MKPLYLRGFLTALLLPLLPMVDATMTANGDVTWALWDCNGHWYSAVVVDGGVSQDNAAALAAAMGGHLATAVTLAENEFIFTLIDQPEYWVLNGLHIRGPWIGGVQPPASPEPDGNWQWVTGEPFEYMAWASGEPNDSAGENAIHYISQTPPARASTWNDLSALSLLPGFVVEIDADPPEVEPSTGQICSSGNVVFSVTSSGSAPFNYEWQVGNPNSPGSWVTLTNDPVSLGCGGTAYALTPSESSTAISVTPCTGVSTYEIRAIVANTCSEVSSDPVTLVVFPGGTGDGNADDTTDGNDVQGLVEFLVDGGWPSVGYCAYDLNADGVVDTEDVSPFVAALLE